jgi:hypothetical protein
MSDKGNTPSYIGSCGDLALFSLRDKAVVIDTSCNLVLESGNVSVLSTSKKWELLEEPTNSSVLELADAALIDLDVKILTASAGRLYTIPKGAQSEAEKALEWRKEEGRGGTPVGVNTARTLARGGQIGIEKVRHIAKYFPRHEVDKKGKGWSPGEDNFPSNGRIAWALWGGDTAWRWAQAIVERENKAMSASGIGDSYETNIDSFKKSMYLDPIAAPEFMARVRMDGSGIDRLYKVDIDGSVYVWDDGSWDNLGHVEGDIWTYDKALDDPYDTCEKSHIPIDPDSAIIVAAKMQEDPTCYVTVDEIDEEESSLVAFAISDIDWQSIDQTLTAAATSGKGGKTNQDGTYTPDERSKLAGSQLRDAAGLFAKMGGRVVPSGDASKAGTITATDADTGMVTVKTDSGETVTVAAKDTDTEENFQKKQLPMGDLDKPLDVSGILAKPRTPINQPYARLPGTLPPMGAEDLHELLYNWPGWVQSQRDEYTPSGSSDSAFSSKEEDSDKKEDSKKEVYDHPLLRKWRKDKDKPKDHDPSMDWANPVVAAAPMEAPARPVPSPAHVIKAPEKKDASKAYQMSPATSDVQPLYFAIVADDDPRAVLDLVSIVPASSVSPEPMTYHRVKGKWVRNVSILNDLKSATPPPVVPLNSKILNDVLIQVDQSAGVTASASYDFSHLLMVLWGPNEDIISTFGDNFFNGLEEGLPMTEALTAAASIQAAGGLDRSRGNAEHLRQYWAHGEGAAKIKWGAKGDWKRCVRHLGKFLGVRAKGYCQLRHKEATGMYTGNRSGNSHGKFAMEEVLTKNYGRKTKVTQRDLLTPIDEILKDKDDMYEDNWSPPQEITSLMEEESCNKAMTAAGGLDRNRGNAEKLRRYWTVGKGASKIRWGTGGDWTRCVRNLSKYMGPRSSGYCALRHKEMNGVWTGDKSHRQMYGRKSGGRRVFSTEVLKSTSQVIQAADLNAKTGEIRDRVSLVASVSAQPGAKFMIPLVIPEDMESGDGRKFRKGSITMRELPLPLLWQIKTAEGHNGSVVVGRIDYIERVENGLGNATGVFDTGHYGREAERLVRNGFIRGVSADMDQFEAKEDKSEASDSEDDDTLGKKKLIINKARIMAATIVPKPAFQQCSIIILPDSQNTTINDQEKTMIPDGVYVDDADGADAQALVACGFVAGAIPIEPPTDWFENPRLSGPTPLTVDDTGRVFGHIAAWHVDHIGLSYGTKPPRSRSNYGYFHTGVVRTDSGKDMPVGQLTLAGGHASLEASAFEAVKHYDDTASAIADVHAGEDQFGIWVAGSLRPGAQPEQIRALRASAPSGDWRPIKGSLELVAVCQVNVPGFPIARARVASGAIMALVAAGAATLAKMKSDPVAEMQNRIAKLEEITTPKEDLSARVASAKARIDEFAGTDEFGYISREERKALAAKGEALPDGSYPIRSVGDLKNAVQAYGRSTKQDRAKVRKHIEKRARALNVRHLIPEEWKSAATAAVTASAEDLKARLAAAQEALGKTFATEDEVPVAESAPEAPVAIDAPLPGQDIVGNPEEGGFKYEPGKNQPRDYAGRFRDVLARLNDNLGVGGNQAVVDQIKQTDQAHMVGNYKDAAKSASDLLDILERLDDNALNAVSVDNVRLAAKELGEVISNLPLPFSNQAQKVRYSDLPPALRGLMDNMITRLEAKIGAEDAAIATKDLKGFISGSDLYSQSEISSQMAKMLRLLT